LENKSYLLKVILFLVYSLSTTFLYIFYLFLASVGALGNLFNGFTYFCWYLAIFLCACSIVLFLLVNIAQSRKYIESLIGAPFLEKYSLKGLKGLLPVILFLFPFVAPLSLEEYTYHSRMLIYNDIMEPLNIAYT
jgi:hypothetical protein